MHDEMILKVFQIGFGYLLAYILLTVIGISNYNRENGKINEKKRKGILKYLCRLNIAIFDNKSVK